MQLQSGKSMLIEAAVLIYQLEDECLYSPWQVAASGYHRTSQRQDYDRIRLNLGEWSRYHNIRESFENRDESGQRQGRFPAWFGQTWKEHLGYKDLEAAKNWIAQQELKKSMLNPNEPTSQGLSKNGDHPTEAKETKVPQRRFRLTWPPKPWAWISLLPVAAALIFFFNLRPESASPPSTAFIQVEEVSTNTATLSVREFSTARRKAREKRIPERFPQFQHPTILDLNWKIALMDEPILAQTSIMPNCVFLVSRIHKDMMPF